MNSMEQSNYQSINGDREKPRRVISNVMCKKTIKFVIRRVINYDNLI